MNASTVIILLVRLLFRQLVRFPISSCSSRRLARESIFNLILSNASNSLEVDSQIPAALANSRMHSLAHWEGLMTSFVRFRELLPPLSGASVPIAKGYAARLTPGSVEESLGEIDQHDRKERERHACPLKQAGLLLPCKPRKNNGEKQRAAL